MTRNQRFWSAFIVGLLAAAAFLAAIYSLSGILWPFVAGIIGAYVFSNSVDRLESWHISRGLGSALVIIALVVGLIAVALIAMPRIEAQLLSFTRVVPQLAARASDSFTECLGYLFPAYIFNLEVLQKQFIQNLSGIMNLLLLFFANLLSSGTMIANLLSWLILTPLVTFYFLKDWPRLIGALRGLIPLSYRQKTLELAQEMDQILSAYGRGQALVCLVLSLLYTLALLTIGLTQGIFAGFITGLLSFIPYVGALIGFFVSCALALAQTEDLSLWPYILLVFVIVSILETTLLVPRFIGRTIRLHPLWIMFALLTAGSWFGFIGLVLTLPIAAIIGILVRLGVIYYQQSSFYQRPI